MQSPSPRAQAIYAAVYESRLIFRRVRSYVLYRVAATVQIVVVLCALIFGWNAELKPLYVVLLALFNDATITPIAHDNASPSPLPETPTVGALLLAALCMGLAQAGATILFFVYGERVTAVDDFMSSENSAVRQVAVYCQISIAVELLIFACRAPKPVFTTKPPSLALFASVMGGNLVTTLMCAYAVVVSAALGAAIRRHLLQRGWSRSDAREARTARSPRADRRSS